MKKTLYILAVILTLGYVVWSLCVMSQRGVFGRSEGLNLQRMEQADSAIYRAIADGEFPGAVLCVVRRSADGESMGELEYLKAYGHRAILSADGRMDSVEMTEDAVFDLASLSKCVGTTLAFMSLVEDGKVRLTDRVDRYIEDFKAWDSIAEPEKGKRRIAKTPQVVESEDITIQHLLTHTSGLPAFINVQKFVQRCTENGATQDVLRDSLVRHIATESKRLSRPGDKVRYSCLNFVILQAIIEQIAACGLNDFAATEVFGPLGLKNTWYNALDAATRPFDATTPIVPTERQADGTVLYGEVHDPIARVINRGVSGNAGLFSTAEDLAVVASMLMNGGVVRLPKAGMLGKIGFTTPVRLYSEQTIERFFQIPEIYAGLHTRALGWDAAYDKGGCYGDLMTADSVASHTGYTGTSMAIDTAEGVAVILLTNRVHPTDTGSLSRTRAVVSNIVMSALE